MSKGGLLERVTELETKLGGIIETVNALCRVVGPQEVQAKLGEMKRAEMAEPIAQAVKKGELKASEKVGPESLVVGVQWRKDGTFIFPGRFQLFVNGMVEDVRTKIVGMGVGAEVTLSDGKIKVSEIYDKVTKLDRAIDEAKAYIEKAELPAKPKKAPRKKR